MGLRVVGVILLILLLMLPVSLYLTRAIILLPKLRTDMLTRKGTNALSLLFPVQTLHLPASKVMFTVVTSYLLLITTNIDQDTSVVYHSVPW